MGVIMIRFNIENISRQLDKVFFKTLPIVRIMRNNKILWEGAFGCFSSGYWKENDFWKENTYWK